MGPAATASFAERLVALTPAATDQNHIPALICNDPRIPDRSTTLMGNGSSPLSHMLRGIQMLNHCTKSIWGVKAGRVAEAFAPVAAGIDALKARGARAVVLGYTELPL